MKIKIEKAGFVSAIQTVQNVVSAKSALPILANMLIVAQDKTLKLITTDLDIGITCVIPVEIQETGAITVPTKRFGDIIKELPGDSAIITSKKNNMVTIETESCQFKIMGLPAEEFPKLPEFKDREIIKIEVEGVLIAIGWIPNTRIFGRQLQLDKDGYIIADGTKTRVEGVFVAGEVTDNIYRQVVTSCGSGAMAALDAIHYLESI